MKETIINSEDIYNLLTGRTPIMVSRYLSHNLKQAKIELTREQWSVMAVLWKQDGCSQQVLAEETNRDKPGITRLVDILEKEGYISRRPAEKDKRLNLIFLTAKGKAIEQHVNEVVHATIAAATAGISTEEIEALKKLFNHIYNNLEKRML